MTTTVTRRGAESFNDHDAVVFSWTLAAGETGDYVLLPAYADRSVHFTGVFGGATVVLEGSNEGSDGAAPASFKTLNDAFGVALSKTADALAVVVEMTRLARPRVTGGDGTTAIKILLFAKR